MYQELTSKYRVIAAPNSMKGSIDAFRFAAVIGKAFLAVSDRFDVVQVPVADGGDLTAEVLGRAMKLNEQVVRVRDPRGRRIPVKYRLGREMAVMEMADASGMKLLAVNELDPMRASSAGTGEMIRDAVLRGATKILLGIGGSATIDGGMGLLEGLGVVFFDHEGKQLAASGEDVGRIAGWDASSLSVLEGTEIRVICDVDNPLSGTAGAVQVFGKQKGAKIEMLPVLEQNLKYFADLIRKDKGKDVSGQKGMGAAGGVNLALVGFLNAEIVPGAGFVLDTIGFDKALEQASLVITGEGKIDMQTFADKAPYAVYKRAKQQGIPVFAIGGSVTPEAGSLFDRAYSLMNNNVDLETAVKQAEKLIFERAVQAAGDFLSDMES